MKAMKRVPHILAVCSAMSLALMGCVERTIHITSDPPGALVHLNDVEIGRTPCQTAFLHYGTYDVRLSLAGYESYMGSAEAVTPPGDLPGIDLAAELLPVRFKNRIDWHFDLQPINDDDPAILERANALRSRLRGAENAAATGPVDSAAGDSDQ